MLRIIRKIPPIVFGAIILMSFYGMMEMRHHSTETMPDRPQPERGRMIAMDANFGKTVYVSPAEEKAIAMSYVILGLVAVSAGAMLFYRLLADSKESG